MTMSATLVDNAPLAGAGGAKLRYDRILNSVYWFCMATSSIVFVEPAPYDFIIFVVVGLWALGGFTVHRAILPFVFLVGLWVFGGFAALVPYWNETDPVDYMFHTLFIASTGVFYALFFTDNTSRRVELMLSGFIVSCVFAAVIAVASWLGYLGGSEDLVKDGRAMAPFKDPNVLGTYMVLGVVYLVQQLLLGRARYLPLTLAALAIVLTALFLSFSRGSWGATVLSVMLMTAMSFRTASSAALRLRIVVAAAAFFALAGVGLMGALSVDSVREFFFQRAAVTQDYDEGPTGRFGNQIRSIPMLLERPNGFGPLRYRLIFDLDPHNSYVNAFASNGWLGGFSFILLVLSTSFVGFRLALTHHPYTRLAQAIWPAQFAFFLQGFQIDLDHWRFFYLTLGAIWGMEAARRRWLSARKTRARSAEA